MAIQFDGPTKLMTLTTGTTSVSVRELWSRWVDWFLTDDNSKYLPAFTSIGGDEISSIDGTFVPIYGFLMNGWRIKPQEANHTLSVTDGILVVNGGGDPFVNTTGSYVVRINYQQPVQAITVSTSGAQVDIPAIVSGVWNAADGIEPGLTPTQALRVLTSILAGKTTIVDHEDGTATVVFRDINDLKDRVTAETEDSERLEVTLDVD
jgi:hypothetical protein